MSRALIAALLLVWPASALAQPGAGTFERVPSFGANPGALDMYRYVPSPAPPAGAPVVVALHACTMDAAAFRDVGWEPLADTYGFYVVYPQQRTANNGLMCFNWFGEGGDEANLRRGEGENRSILSMVDFMGSDLGADMSRVYVTGHSSGAAMAMVMLATWPDRFAAGGVTAAIPYRCATTVTGAFSCQSPGVDRSPGDWAALVTGASPHPGPWPRLSVWHGTSDTVVDPSNQREVIEQWTALMGLSTTPDSTSTVDGYPRSVWAGGRIERWEITGAGHASFVDPESGCGAAASYVADADVCSTRHIADFFGLTGAPPPPPAADAGPPGRSDAGPPLADGGASPGPDGGAPRDAGSWGEWTEPEDAGSWGGWTGEPEAGASMSLADAGPPTPRDPPTPGCSVGAAPRPAPLVLLGLVAGWWVRRRRVVHSGGGSRGERAR